MTTASIDHPAHSPATPRAVAAPRRTPVWLAPLLAMALTVGLPSAQAAAGTAVASALDRPAVMARQPQRSVVLGAAHAGERLVVVGERGIVLLSDDGGANWRQAKVPLSVSLTAVRFVDAQHGYAVGHGGVVLATADGGQTWVKRLDGVQAAKIALQAAAEGGDPRALKDAQRLVADGPDKPLLDLSFSDAQHGIVVGAYNLAFATEDGGATWTSAVSRIDNPKGLHLYAVRARGNTMLLAGEQGLALRSDDGGRSFHRLTVPYVGSFFTAEILDAAGHDLVLAGLRGNVWRSSDGGATWAQSTVPSQASITGSVLQPAAGEGVGSAVLVNQAGQLLAAQGDAYVAVPGPPMPPLNGVLALTGGGFLALSIAGPINLPAAHGPDAGGAAAGNATR